MDALYRAQSWADVVRESQEIVELALKGLLRACGVDPPRIHDVADVLVAEASRLPPGLAGDIARLADVSRSLRRDRELAFCGAEDLTPQPSTTSPTQRRPAMGPASWWNGSALTCRDTLRSVRHRWRPSKRASCSFRSLPGDFSGSPCALLPQFGPAQRHRAS